jgi:hypothetical protein
MLGTQQTPELVAYLEVAVTGSFLQLMPLQYLDASFTVFNQACMLESIGNQAHARPLGNEHLGQEFLCQHESITPHPVVGNEEPAGEAGFQVVQTVADD